MDTKATLVALEEEFWRGAGSRDRYARALAPDAVHVLPGLGVVGRESVLDGVAGAEPWTSFALYDTHIVTIAHDAAALVYTARAERGSGAPYSAAIASVYRHSDDRWQLVLHQQTPLDEQTDKSQVGERKRSPR